ncbi:MAG TPA: DinB family protein [Acidothermaceae bacterium]
MSESDPKADLRRYLQVAREAVLWKLDALSEYEIRRPMTPAGTNLLGLVKHLANVEVGYFGETFGRPFDGPLPWVEGPEGEEPDPNADLWATVDESRDQIVGLYQAAWAHADKTIETLDLATIGAVPWWPADHAEVTLHKVLVHVIAETNRHAGHADIVRELIDGATGLRAGNHNMADGDQAWWQEYRNRLEQAARDASPEQLHD